MAIERTQTAETIATQTAETIATQTAETIATQIAETIATQTALVATLTAGYTPVVYVGSASASPLSITAANTLTFTLTLDSAMAVGDVLQCTVPAGWSYPTSGNLSVLSPAGLTATFACSQAMQFTCASALGAGTTITLKYAFNSFAPDSGLEGPAVFVFTRTGTVAGPLAPVSIWTGSAQTPTPGAAATCFVSALTYQATRSPTPTPTASRTATPSRTITPTATATPTATVTATNTPMPGAVAVSPGKLWSGRDNLGRQFEITYTQGELPQLSGTLLRVVVPDNWTQPQVEDATSAGYTLVSAESGGVGSITVTGRTLEIQVVGLSAFGKVHVTYGSQAVTASAGVDAPLTPGSYAFKATLGDPGDMTYFAGEAVVTIARPSADCEQLASGVLRCADSRGGSRWGQASEFLPRIVPNPWDGTAPLCLDLGLPMASAEISLYTLDGRLAARASTGAGALACLEARGLASGVYFVHATGTDLHGARHEAIKKLAVVR